MNIWYLSDLHLEERDYDLSLLGWCPPHVSALVLAGDIGNGVAAVDWMNTQQAAIGLPVVYVPGNHDLYNFYGTAAGNLLARMKERAAPDVHILDKERITIKGVHFLGATLWTDFAYSRSGECERDLMLAARTFPDFSSINAGEGELLTPETWAKWHYGARDWLDAELLGMRDRGEGPRVVVTHYLPSPRSLDPRFLGFSTNAAFCSQLPDALLGAADVWIHGHTHHACNWKGPGGVQVVCNPMGYSDDGYSPGFDPIRWVTV